MISKYISLFKSTFINNHICNSLYNYYDYVYQQCINFNSNELQKLFYFSIFIILYIINYIFNICKRIVYFIKNRNIIMYDYFFGNINFPLSTPNLFYSIINELPDNCKILDFGCGNGLCYDNDKIAKLIINKNITITGIDINEEYIKICKKRVSNNSLNNNVNIINENIYNHNSTKYDYIVFCESAPLMSKDFIINTLQYMYENILNQNGEIIFVNNLNNNPQQIVKKLKPLLKYITFVDFGYNLDKKFFNDIASSTNKHIEYNVIENMNTYDVAKHYKSCFIYRLLKLFGLKDYNITQYKITFF